MNQPRSSKLIQLGHNAAAASRERLQKEEKESQLLQTSRKLDDIVQEDQIRIAKTKCLEEQEKATALLVEEARLREKAADNELARILEERRQATADRENALRKQQRTAEKRLKYTSSSLVSNDNFMNVLIYLTE